MDSIILRTTGGEIELPYFTHLSHLVSVSDTLQAATHRYYRSPAAGPLTYCPVPYLVGITGACENVDTLFRVLNRMRVPAFFTQTGQLMLEFAQLFKPGVYTVIHSGRDEGEEDERHLLEFDLTEEEFGYPLAFGAEAYDENRLFENLLLRIEAAVKSVTHGILTTHGMLLEQTYRRDVEAFLHVLDHPFLRVSYDEAVTLLQQHGFPALTWGDDLKAEHEAAVVAAMNQEVRTQGEASAADRPVFIMRYPKRIKFFNMKRWGGDERLALSADLILPVAGEAVGSAVREHDPARLRQSLLESTMFRLHRERGGRYEDFSWYIDRIVGSGKVAPHAGYGLGNQRLLQWIFGCLDIRQCSLYSQMAAFTGDFSEARRGTAFVYAAPPKTILLSIADEAKPDLLPSIQAMAENQQYILYATPGTKQYLDSAGVRGVALVHKVSAPHLKPNLGELLAERGLGTIINIPSRQVDGGQSTTDGQLIRQLAVRTGTYLATDLEVAHELLANLANGKKQSG